MTITAAVTCGELDTRLKELYWEYFYIKKLLAPQKTKWEERKLEEKG